MRTGQQHIVLNCGTPRPYLPLSAILVIIAFLEVAQAAIVQTYRLDQALAHERRLRAMAEDERARAEAEARRARAVLERLQPQR
jgi:hypothetical protein